jgi:hypothetical protein
MCHPIVLPDLVIVSKLRIVTLNDLEVYCTEEYFYCRYKQNYTTHVSNTKST